MTRKLKKGYYVSGQFVAAGSELDLELKRELKGGEEPSRTELKRESSELQKLGVDLLTLRTESMQSLALPEKLQDAVRDAQRISNFEGRRRQLQYIGKLMRQLDASQLDRIRAALVEQHSGSAHQTLALHQAERWRDELVRDDHAVERWLGANPRTDSQQLRALVRQARKDALPAQPGATPRHGKAYRELFQLVREQLTAPSDNGTTPHADIDPAT
jgi:ribosome-associated protein